MKYILLNPDTEPPNVSEMRPFRSIVIVEETVEQEWQEWISDWLVGSGCLYMMAWGKDCSSWDDSVDHSNLKEWDYKDIPEDKFVMTTWHDDESLEDVFWFSKHIASHPSVDIRDTLLVHIAQKTKENEFIDLYSRA